MVHSMSSFFSPSYGRCWVMSPCSPQANVIQSAGEAVSLSDACQRPSDGSSPLIHLYVYRSKTMKHREKEPATDKVQQKIKRKPVVAS